MEETKNKIPTYEEFMALLAEDRRKNQEEHEHFLERWARAEKEQKKLDEKFKQMCEKLEGIGFSNGLVAEDAVFNALKNTMKFGGHSFDEVRKEPQKFRVLPNGERINGQYDILMVNGTYVAIIEVKYRVRRDDVIELNEKEVAAFRQLYPEYANCKVLLGIGGLTFDSSAQKEALKNGIGMLTINGSVLDIDDKNLKVF